MTPESLAELLESLGIPFSRHDHAAVFTCDEAAAAVPDSGGVQTKNIFLRDKRGRRHILLVTTCAKTVDINGVADVVDADRLSFASPERLMRFLGVKPGSVTLLGLVYDRDHAVEVLIDSDVWSAERVHCHPLVNTSTFVLTHDSMVRFLEHTGHTARVMNVP